MSRASTILEIAIVKPDKRLMAQQIKNLHYKFTPQEINLITDRLKDYVNGWMSFEELTKGLSGDTRLKASGLRALLKSYGYYK